VPALTGLPADGTAQHVVGVARTIARDDMDGLRRSQLGVNLPQQIDQLWIHLSGLVLAPIAQDPVDLLHGVRQALASLHILDGQRFLAVDVVEGNRTVTSCIGRRRRAARDHREHDDDTGCEPPKAPLQTSIPLSARPRTRVPALLSPPSMSSDVAAL